MAPKSKLQALSIRLISMKTPEANEESLASADLHTQQQGESKLNAMRSPRPWNLLIHPNEPSEIVVKLKNSSNRTLLTDLRVEGNFPEGWCQIGMEGNEHGGYTQSPDPNENADISLTTSTLVSHLELFDLESFRLYVRPTSLYLDFLPDVYREVDFVGRLLKIFEECFEPDVQISDALWAYLDPMLSPETMLPFLAHWVGWELTPAIDMQRQRYLIKQAMQIYRWRGTRRGLRFYIHLFTGLPLDEHLPESEKHISVFEVTGRGFVLGAAQIGINTSAGGRRPFHFIVRIRNDSQNRLDLALIHQIIEREKPAFCTYDLEII